MGEITEAQAASFVAAVGGDDAAAEAFNAALREGLSLGRARVPTLREAIRDAMTMGALAGLQGLFLSVMEEVGGLIAESEPVLSAAVKAAAERSREDLTKRAMGGRCDRCGSIVRMDCFAVGAADWTPVVVMRHLQERGLHLRPEGGLDDPAPHVCIACLLQEISDEEVSTALGDLAAALVAKGRALQALEDLRTSTDPGLDMLSPEEEEARARYLASKTKGTP